MSDFDAPWMDHRDELLERVVQRGRVWKRRRRYGLTGAALAVVVALVAGLYLPGRSPSVLHVANPDHESTTLPQPARAGALLIGDAVMLGARSALEHAIPGARVDAAVSRQFTQAASILDADKEGGALPPTVVIALGTNGPSEGDVFDRVTTDFKAVMNTVGSESTVYFVTVKVPRPWEGEVNRALYAEAPAFPHAHVLAWKDFSTAHADWFLADGIHLTTSGQAAYATFIRDGVRASIHDQATASAAAAGDGDARAAIAYAFGHFFDPALSADQRIALIQGGEAMRSFIEASFAAHEGEAAAGAIIVDGLTLHGDTADVSFHALFQGRESPANPGRLHGTAVKEGGNWKISRATYCMLSAGDGEHCPAQPG